MNDSIKRNFILGEEWIYYKIYVGAKTADRILEEAIQPIVEELLKRGKIDKWFFIRYADPDLHLRFRLHYNKPGDIGVIIKKIYKSLHKYVEQDLIWKIQVDTYQREIERYGNDTMELSEHLFFIDSGLFLKMIPFLKNPLGDSQRWIIALKLTDYLLDCFLYEMKDKLSFFRVLKEGYGREFGMNRFLKSQLDAKFQKERKNIEVSLNSETEHKSIISPLLDLAKSYKASILPLASDIIKLNESSLSSLSLNDLTASYVHMMMNRIFSSKQRIHEMVIYDFLFRYYRSSIARMTASKETIEE